MTHRQTGVLLSLPHSRLSFVVMLMPRRSQTLMRSLPHAELAFANVVHLSIDVHTSGEGATEVSDLFNCL